MIRNKSYLLAFSFAVSRLYQLSSLDIAERVIYWLFPLLKGSLEVFFTLSYTVYVISFVVLLNARTHDR